jgi:hypothetical protein
MPYARLEGASVLDLERDIEQDGLSQLSRDGIERLRERVVLRKIIVSIHLERPSEHPERASGCDDRVILGKQGWVKFWRAPSYFFEKS